MNTVDVLRWINAALVLLAIYVAYRASLKNTLISKELLLQRIAEIQTKRCPECGALLFVSHSPRFRYLACENQYDPYNTLKLAGTGTCHRMITSLEILEKAAVHYGVELPTL